MLSVFGVDRTLNSIKTEEELLFVQYLESAKSMGKIDKMLGCTWLRWRTSDEVDYSKMKGEESEVQKTC